MTDTKHATDEKDDATPDATYKGHVGLRNAGATCYLNSLLQALYMTREVRQLVFGFRPPTPPVPLTIELADSAAALSDSTLAANAAYATQLARSVPYQLQLLFARLSLSTHRSSIETDDLTSSFGWSKSESFRQHDVQELMRVLFGALERTWGPEASSLYTGKLLDVIECNVCHEKRTRVDPFQDLSLSVVGHAGLTEALKSFIKPEVMDGDNSLRCQSDACGGQKQPATKGLQLDTLPTILTFQLKRFVFDFSLMQRTKVNDAFDFPEEIDMAPFLPGTSAANTQYELFAILIHSGVAMGGHYFAYLRSLTDGRWYEFNDARVILLKQGVEQALKLSKGTDHGALNSTAGTATAAAKGGTNAYMLMYRRKDAAASTIDASSSSASQTDNSSLDSISPEVRALIAQEECKYQIDQAALEKERRTLEIQVHFHAFPVYKTQHDMGLTVREFTRELLQHYALGSSRRLEDIRLRKYDPTLRWASSIYVGDSESTLEEAKWLKQTILLLELKPPQESWPDYSPDTIPLRCVFVGPSNVARLVDESLHPIESSDVFPVEISKSRTIQELRQAIVSAAQNAPERSVQSIPSPANQRIWILTDTQCIPISKDPALTLNEFDLYPGRFLYIEHSLEPELLKPMFEKVRCSIEICFNLPIPAESATMVNGKSTVAQPEYTQKLRCSRNDTLGVVKAKIAAALGLDPSEFRVARTHTAPQFKDPGETLADLQLVDQSGIFVALGRPLAKEEVQVSCYLYQTEGTEEPAVPGGPAGTLTNVDLVDSIATPTCSPALSKASSASSVASSNASVPASGTSTPVTAASGPSRFQFLFSLPLRCDILISDLKLLLLDYLAKKRPHATIPGANGFGIEHVRVRDKKGLHSRVVYIDSSSLSENASTLGSVKLEDGFEICLQRLDASEVWTKDRLMLQVQQWHPKQGKLGQIQDLVTRKNISVGGMKQQLWKLLHNGVAFDGGAKGGAESPATSMPGELVPPVAISSSEPDPIATSTPSQETLPPLDPLTSGSVSPPTIPAVPVIPPPIQLAKGKLTGRMKKADMPKVAWLSKDAGETKLLRNALSIRAGELMLFMEDLSAEEKQSMAQAKAKKAADAAVAASTAADPNAPTPSGKPPTAKPWKSGSILRRKVGGASVSSVPVAKVREVGLRIAGAEEWQMMDEAEHVSYQTHDNHTPLQVDVQPSANDAASASAVPTSSTASQ